jgi:hypothetical protein
MCYVSRVCSTYLGLANIDLFSLTQHYSINQSNTILRISQTYSSQAFSYVIRMYVVHGIRTHNLKPSNNFAYYLTYSLHVMSIINICDSF